LDPATRTRFVGDFRIAAKTVSKGVSSGRARTTVTGWRQWLEFCDELGLDPFLKAFEDKVPILQVFLYRVRIGELAADGNKIRARSAEDYVRAVAQTFLSMGADDPRLNSVGKIDFRLSRMVSAWKKEDPPSWRVKPIPIQVIRRIAYIAQHLPTDSPALVATADMIIIAFFYLLRPGEYTDSPSDTTPFAFQDVMLCIGPVRLNVVTSTDAELLAASSASLTFTTQKNGVENEVIKLGKSGDPYLCPVLALARRVIHLRNNNAPGHTPLARVFLSNGRTTSITPKLITSSLRTAVEYIGLDLGFLPNEVSARSLRAGGATALLVGKVDPDIIQLIGRWRSDEMLRYLHLSAEPVMKDFARKMLQAEYNLAPSQLVPSH
jgi:hypothetical protein